MKDQLERRAGHITGKIIRLASDIGLGALTPGYQTSEVYKSAAGGAKPDFESVLEQDIASLREDTAKGQGNVFYHN